MSTVTVVRACPICESDEARPLREVDGWPLVTCQCGFVYAPCILEDTADEFEVTDDFVGHPRARHRQIHRLLQRVTPTGGTVVDIGAGDADLGVLIHEADTYEYIGYEPSASHAAVAARQGVTVRPVPFDGDVAADAVVLDNVIEHVADPVALLTDAIQSLRPGGVLVVIVPNRWDIRQLRPGWRYSDHWIPPEHINYFTARTLRRILKSLGLQVHPFGFKALGLADWRYWPRAALELVGTYPFGLNVYGTKAA